MRYVRDLDLYLSGAAFERSQLYYICITYTLHNLKAAARAPPALPKPPPGSVLAASSSRTLLVRCELLGWSSLALSWVAAPVPSSRHRSSSHRVSSMLHPSLRCSTAARPAPSPPPPHTSPALHLASPSHYPDGVDGSPEPAEPERALRSVSSGLVVVR